MRLFDRNPGPAQEKLRAFVESLPTLTGQDYRSLVGFLNYARDKTTATPFADAVEAALRTHLSAGLQSTFRNALDSYALTHASQDSGGTQVAGLPSHHELRFDRSFADQALMLVRMAYPFGINLANPGWEKNKQSSFDAHEELTFAPDLGVDNDRVTIRPLDPHTSLISFQCRTRRGWEHRSYELSDGASAIIGRKLSIPPPFGDTVDQALPLQMHVDCDVGSNEHFSRAGILVVRHQGRIYLFDRGCRARIVFREKNGNVGTYSPESVVDADGRWQHGHTIAIATPPKPRPEDSAKTVYEQEPDNGVAPAPQVKLGYLPDEVEEERPAPKGTRGQKLPWYRRIFTGWLRR